MSARLVGAWLVGAAATVALVGLSNVPWNASPSSEGELRLAWRWRSQRIERCRSLSAEEQAKLPVHMRRTEECERGLQPYRLAVTVDGRPAVDLPVAAAGAESDRPLSVFQRVPLAPGRHEARVVFAPSSAADARVATADSARPATLVLDTSFVVAPLQILLLTVDEERGVLTLRTR